MKRQSHTIFLPILLCLFLTTTGFGCARGPRFNLDLPQERGLAVDRYLIDFSMFDQHSKTGRAIRDVLMRMPKDALEKVFDRRRPIIFIQVYSSGTARFASSSEVIMMPKDAPAFQDGMTILRLSDALEGGSQEAIEGIAAHEIAHRVLDHIRLGHVSCQAEREANRLIKSWGFKKEYEAASHEFGHAKEGGGVAGCQEIPGVPNLK